jgi:hypothetical protein
VEASSRQAETDGAGYLCFHSGSGGEAWAALLVVTPNGLPQEFLYSGPLRPTPVQTILYQDQLVPQVRQSLVRALLRGLRSRLIFMALPAEDADPVLLAEIRRPVLALGGETGAWMADSDLPAERLRERIEEVVGVREPLGRAMAALAYVVEFERSRADKASS